MASAKVDEYSDEARMHPSRSFQFRMEDGGGEAVSLDLLQKKQAEVDEMRRNRMEYLEGELAKKDNVVQKFEHEIRKLKEDISRQSILLQKRDNERFNFMKAHTTMRQLGDEQQRLLKEANIELAKSEQANRDEAAKLVKVETFYQRKISELQNRLEKQEFDSNVELSKLREQYRVDMKGFQLEKSELESAIETERKQAKMIISEEIKRIRDEGNERYEAVMETSHSLESKNRALSEEAYSLKQRYDEQTRDYDARERYIRELEKKLKDTIASIKSNKGSVEIERDHLRLERNELQKRFHDLQLENDNRAAEMADTANQMKSETESIKRVYESDLMRSKKLYEAELKDLQNKISNIDNKHKEFVLAESERFEKIFAELQEARDTLIRKNEQIEHLETNLSDITIAHKKQEEFVLKTAARMHINENGDSSNKSGVGNSENLCELPVVPASENYDSGGTFVSTKKSNDNHDSMFTPDTTAFSEDVEYLLNQSLELKMNKNSLSFMDDLVSPSALSGISVSDHKEMAKNLGVSKLDKSMLGQEHQHIISKLEAENVMLRASVGNMRAEMELLLSQQNQEVKSSATGGKTFGDKGKGENDAIAPSFQFIRLSYDDSADTLEKSYEEKSDELLHGEIQELNSEIHDLAAELGMPQEEYVNAIKEADMGSLEIERDMLMELSNTLRARLNKYQALDMSRTKDDFEANHPSSVLLEVAILREEFSKLREQNDWLTNEVANFTKFPGSRKDVLSCNLGEEKGERIDLSEEVSANENGHASEIRKRPKTAPMSCRPNRPIPAIASTSTSSHTNGIENFAVDGERKVQNKRDTSRTSMSERETISQKERVHLEQKRRQAIALAHLQQKRRIRNYAIKEDITGALTSLKSPSILHSAGEHKNKT